MKTFKAILCILIFIIWTNVYSDWYYYSSENLEYYRGNLISSSKWLNYLNKFDAILDKYSDNVVVLIKLSDRVQELKDSIESRQNNYSFELESLIYYIDQKINKSLVVLWVYELEGIEEEVYIDNRDSELFEEDYVDSNKSIVAWDDFIVFSWNTSSLYESVEVWKVIFYIEWNNASDLKYSLSRANLYINWWGINSISSSSIDIVSQNKVSLTFNNLKNFIVPEHEVDFRLWIEVNSIWYEKVWKTIKDLSITNVVLSEWVWINSWKKINAFSTTTSVEPFSIVPWIPIVSIIADLIDSAIVRFNIKWLFWDNTIGSNNSTPSLKLNKLQFSFSDNSGTAIFKLVNSDDSTDSILWIKNWNILEFDLSSLNINNKTISKWKWEDFKIYIFNTTSWVSLELLKDGIIYDVLWITNSENLNINLNKSINLWYRDF